MPKVSLIWPGLNHYAQFDLFILWRCFGTGSIIELFLNPIPRLAYRTISRFIPPHPTDTLPVPYLEPPHSKAAVALLILILI